MRNFIIRRPQAGKVFNLMEENFCNFDEFFRSCRYIKIHRTDIRHTGCPAFHRINQTPFLPEHPLQPGSKTIIKDPADQPLSQKIFMIVGTGSKTNLQFDLAVGILLEKKLGLGLLIRNASDKMVF